MDELRTPDGRRVVVDAVRNGFEYSLDRARVFQSDDKLRAALVDRTSTLARRQRPWRRPVG